MSSRPARKRRVEVNYQRLNEEDKARFRGAMSKEGQNWVENKVTTIVKLDSDLEVVL